MRSRSEDSEDSKDCGFNSRLTKGLYKVPAKNIIAGEFFESGPCCLDEESGLFTPAHFRSVLAQELARLDRWERPLGLIVLNFALPEPQNWPVFTSLIRDSLRRIDLAARLAEETVAVIMPDADRLRLRRWLRGFLMELERREDFAAVEVSCGLALARPWEGLSGDDLLALASAGLSRDDWRAWESEEEAAAEDNAATAIAADERNLLFAGFKNLGVN